MPERNYAVDKFRMRSTDLQTYVRPHAPAHGPRPSEVLSLMGQQLVSTAPLKCIIDACGEFLLYLLLLLLTVKTELTT